MWLYFGAVQFVGEIDELIIVLVVDGRYLEEPKWVAAQLEMLVGSPRRLKKVKIL
jgi:hypothetical protein